MIYRKCIKNFSNKRSDSCAYLIMQCIVSFFIFIFVNLIKQVNYYSDIETELWFLVRTIIIFLIISLFKIKYSLSLTKSACILLLCFLFDSFIHIMYFPDGSLFSALIILSFTTFLPFFILSIYNYLYFKYIKSIIKQIPSKQKLYLKYICILTVLFLLNIIVPIFFSLLLMIVDIQVFFMIYIFYQVILSKFLPLITFIAAIFLQKNIFYRKKIAPYLIYIVVIGSLADILFYSSVKKDIIIQISFLATFLPMYLVYLFTLVKKKIQTNI